MTPLSAATRESRPSSGWTQQNNTSELQTQALTCRKVVHDAIWVSDETMAFVQMIKTSVTEDKTAEAERVRRRRVKIEETLIAAIVAKPLAKWLTIGIDDFSAQARSSAIPHWMTQQISHPL